MSKNQTIENRHSIISSFFPGTGKSYDTVVNVFSLGLDRYWKRAIYKRVPPSSRILDLACGTGIVTLGLAKRHPGAEIVGVDITDDYLTIYQERIQKHNIKAQFILGNAEDVILDGLFDTVVSSYIPKYVDPDMLLKNISPHIRSGGVIVLHDFTLPSNIFARTIWTAYNHVMNFIGIRLFPEWKEVFDAGLTRLIRETRWFDTFPEMLAHHGFTNIHKNHLSLGAAGIIWAVKS
ncbi:class I SAM-dependent methyltransferase [bacterium]|nr:class I SAM-dependent methyltransferase [bacterium]